MKSNKKKPISNTKNKEERSLAMWIYSQLKKEREGKLNKKKIQMLRSVGITEKIKKPKLCVLSDNLIINEK